MSEAPTAPSADAPLSLTAAMSAMANLPPDEAEDEVSAPATAPEAESATLQESADEADIAAADEQQPPDETEEIDPADNLPPIEAPRSWTKDEKEAFKALPRDHQQNIAERERVREREIRQGQDKIAEAHKAAEAREQAAEQARQQYEQALPQLLQALQSQMDSRFQDIKTWDDVNKMAQEDPVRYMQWDAFKKQEQAVAQEWQAAEGRKAAAAEQEAAKKQNQFKEFAEREAKLFAERVPEWVDPIKGPKLQSDARNLLLNVGFESQELEDLWFGRKEVSLHDHRLQWLISDALKLRQAKTSAKTAPKPVAQPVQRPGVATGRGERVSELRVSLNKQLDKTGSREAALALMRT